MALKVPSNVTWDGLKALTLLSSGKDELMVELRGRVPKLTEHDGTLDLSVCDLHQPAALASKMQAEWMSDERGRVFKLRLLRSGAADAFRCRAVALETVMGCVVDKKCDLLWRVQTPEDIRLLQRALLTSEHCKLLVWVDLAGEETQEALGAELQRLLTDEKLCKADSVAVLLLTSGGSDVRWREAAELSDLLEFDAEHVIQEVGDATAGRKAQALHTELRLHLTSEQQLSSPFELLDEKEFSQLVSKVLPYNSSGGDSEERRGEVRVPIAGMYVDQSDLIVSFCVSEVAFLKRLNHDVLSLKFDRMLGDSLRRALAPSDTPRVVNVEADLTQFAENFERAILAMDKLTVHQTEKMKEVVTRDHVHLYAPVHPKPEILDPRP
jgi:hypothetical protein